MLKRFLRVTDVPFSASVGLLALRVVIGAAFMFHGWGKIQAPFSWMPAGAPIPGFLQALAALSEFGGGLAWILGLLTPLASLGLAVTMAVAVAFHVSSGDPFVAMGGPSWEAAAVYLGISLALLLVGPGRLSVDAAVFGTKR
ncbi:DoxX family protein [Sorangium sp. So ce204]|uniref:DoxX family protein n=1 Tax=Sorangium sp. So ce204 TaxID=3133288 RepID=UPI003F611EBF